MTVLRSAVFNVLFLGGTALTVLFGLPLLALPSRVMITYVRGWSHLMVFLLRVVCRIRVEVTGMEHIPPGGAIIASKHQSAFDTVIWVKLIHGPVYIMKKELRQIPLWGLLAVKCGNVEVDREAGAAALRSMVRGAQAALKAGRRVVIFPEGTRSAPGERVPYQPGVAALAIASGAPVVPVATDSGRFWGRRAFHKRPGTIHVVVLPALPPGLPRAALMARLEGEIEDATARLPGMGTPVDKSGDRDSVISDSSPERTPPSA